MATHNGTEMSLLKLCMDLWPSIKKWADLFFHFLSCLFLRMNIPFVPKRRLYCELNKDRTTMDIVLYGRISGILQEIMGITVWPLCPWFGMNKLWNEDNSEQFLKESLQKNCIFLAKFGNKLAYCKESCPLRSWFCTEFAHNLLTQFQTVRLDVMPGFLRVRLWAP